MEKLLSVFVLGLVLSVPSWAARPLVTDDFGTVDPGKYELELGYTSIRDQADALSRNFDLSFKRGLTPQLDLGIEVPCDTGDISGLDDAFVHVKYKFLEQGEESGLTARLDIKLANGDADRGLGTGFNDYTLCAIYSRKIADLKTHLNLSYTKVGVALGGPSADYTAYSAAVEYPSFGEKGDLVAEYVADTSVSPNPAFIQVGGRIAVKEGFNIDAGYSFGMNGNSIKNSLTTGVHYEF
ncbi:MAG TPA: hypothetical protein VMD02_00530 [Candidatus Omnitrophota bacterium]|nr:hypothetical protein [Candidatus Omnitrophota bacterium]